MISDTWSSQGLNATATGCSASAQLSDHGDKVYVRVAAQTAGIIAAREARRQQEAQRKLAKTRVGKGKTEPNYWDLMGQIR